MTKKKIHVFVEEDQEKFLRELSDTTSFSMSNIVRVALEKYIIDFQEYKAKKEVLKQVAEEFINNSQEIHYDESDELIKNDESKSLKLLEEIVDENYETYIYSQAQESLNIKSTGNILEDYNKVKTELNNPQIRKQIELELEFTPYSENVRKIIQIRKAIKEIKTLDKFFK